MWSKTHLYCDAVQAGFYSDAVEYWIFVRRVADSILSRVRTQDIFLHLLQMYMLITMAQVSLCIRKKKKIMTLSTEKKGVTNRLKRDGMLLICLYSISHI